MIANSIVLFTKWLSGGEEISVRVNSGTAGVGIDWAEADSTIIRLDTAKIAARSTEKLMLVLPMINVRVCLRIKDFL